MRTYTFETLWTDGRWLQSAKRFETLGEAASGLADWLITCAENGLLLAVRIAVIENDNR
jgi:hypothetical protein